MKHIVLLGDSIFDNASYVPGREPVIEQLRGRLPRGDRATLLAVDGAVVASVAGQLTRLSQDATHLVVSAGGNNALENARILDPLARDTEVFAELARVQQRFLAEYRDMLHAVVAARRRTIVCTIYDAIPGLPREAVVGLSLFNDVIVRAAIEAGLPVLDLRFVCTQRQDYSSLSPIEPSEIGGAKIAAAIVKTLAVHDFSRAGTVIYS